MSQSPREKGHDNIVQHLGELMTCLDHGFQGKAWDTMENVNEEMLSLLTGLDKQQLQNTDISHCLQRIQKKFDTWVEACNEYKAQCANELIAGHQREQGIRRYQSTNSMQDE